MEKSASTDSERRRLENSFQKRQSCLAAFVFHFRASERAPPVFIVVASPRLASAADRGRHFHKDRRGAKRRESKTARNRVGVSRDDRLASVIERRAICSGKVIYASAACDRFPRSARSPQDREEEKEKEEKEERTAALSPRFKPFSIATLSRRGGETKSKTNSNTQKFVLKFSLCRISFVISIFTMRPRIAI